MASSRITTLADMADVPLGEPAWRFSVQILGESEAPPSCAASCSLLADPLSKLDELAQTVEHGGAFPVSARHLHLVVSANASLGDCLPDPPAPSMEGTGVASSSPLTSEDEQIHLVSDLSRSYPAPYLTDEELVYNDSLVVFTIASLWFEGCCLNLQPYKPLRG